MTVEEVKKIIDEESLKGGNLFGKRENKENEMVIMNVAEQWLVYATDVNCPLCQGHFELV